MTPRQLFGWASANIPAVHFEYCSNEDYKREEHNLEQRLKEARTIPGTRKLHSFVPISVDKVQVRSFSACTSCKVKRVTSSGGDIDVPLETISGFVTCLHGGQWWLACTLQVYIDERQVKLTFLHPLHMAPVPLSSIHLFRMYVLCQQVIS